MVAVVIVIAVNDQPSKPQRRKIKLQSTPHKHVTPHTHTWTRTRRREKITIAPKNLYLTHSHSIFNGVIYSNNMFFSTCIDGKLPWKICAQWNTIEEIRMILWSGVKHTLFVIIDLSFPAIFVCVCAAFVAIRTTNKSSLHWLRSLQFYTHETDTDFSWRTPVFTSFFVLLSNVHSFTCI